MTVVEVEHRYRPQGAALALMTCRDPEVLMSGPAGTGKSRAALEKLNAVALKYPGMRALIVRKVRDTLGPSVLKTWRENVVAEALAAGFVDFYGGSAEEPPQYRYSNGSTIVLGGMDKASKIMSTEFDVIYVPEAIELTEGDWESLTSRLRNGVMPYQQLIADTNPDTETHWLNVRCNVGTTTRLESRHRDNPMLYDGAGLTPRGRDYMGKLDRLSGVRRLRLRDGLWVAAEGIVYDGWDPAVHLVDEMPDGWETWARYMSIDWGFTNPLVVQWWAEDPDGRLWLYRELYRTGLLAGEAGEIVAGYPERPRRCVGDHASGDREAFRKAAKIVVHPAEKAVDVGIQAVAERLAVADDGLPRLFLLRSAPIDRDQRLVEAARPTCTAEEFPGYVWDRSTAARREKEAPVKDNDHGLDGARYICMDRRSRRRINVGSA